MVCVNNKSVMYKAMKEVTMATVDCIITYSYFTNMLL